MPSPLDVIPFDLLYMGTVVLLVVAVTVGVLRWWSLRRDDDTRPPERQPEESHGYPLASWRYVYDLDKPDAKRAVNSVNEQAETLSKAEQKRRK
ncbi:hypothetical protein ACH9L7_01265 [Haloferax sp. S1W]|uniref:hypothetical protein n=1 Tax=Haloferax sp. S1W TaxID=3377110 RepID=UPI0037C68B4D